MNRQEKVEVVEVFKQKFAKAQIAIITDYKGITVPQISELRKKLRGVGAEMHVVKNRLAKIALKDSKNQDFASKFSGTTAVTLGNQDPVAPAKILVDFAKENEKLVFKAADMNGNTLSIAQIQALANLPSREVLLAKAMGSLLSPARNWVSVLAQIPRQVVNVLAAVRDQKEKGS